MPNQLKVSLENIIPLTEARDHFSQIVAEVQKDKLYVLTKGGKPAVAIIDVKYLETISGGHVNTNIVREEIKKDPTKVGLAKMVTHSTPKMPDQFPSKPISPPPPPPPPRTSPPPPPPKPADDAIEVISPTAQIDEVEKNPVFKPEENKPVAPANPPTISTTITPPNPVPPPPPAAPMAPPPPTPIKPAEVNTSKPVTPPNSPVGQTPPPVDDVPFIKPKPASPYSNSQDLGDMEI